MSISATDFNFVRDLALTKAAIVLEPGKEYLVESRLTPIARQIGVQDASALVQRLRRGGEAQLQAQVVDALTTNETSWFRDRHPFDALGKYMIPELIDARRATRTISIWSAACSSGQEPYSIAMTLLDVPALAGWNIRITATDLSAEMLARAREGHFSQLEINRGLPATHLVRHFERAGTGWRVNEQLRRMVTFEPHNLLNAPPLGGPFDIVFIRNVLIYFSPATKSEVLAKVRRALRPDGFVVLGGAETSLGIDDQLVRTEIARSSVYRLKR
jgi:chemotaxis protein methyltransferase CheR